MPSPDMLGVDVTEMAYYDPGRALQAHTIADRSGTIQGDAIGRGMMSGAGNYYSDVAGQTGPLDPAARGVQEGAAAYFGDVALNGGLDAVAEAEYQRRRAQADQDARSKREAALQAAEMRGQGGGGAALLADLTSGQQAATKSWVSCIL